MDGSTPTPHDDGWHLDDLMELAAHEYDKVWGSLSSRSSNPKRHELPYYPIAMRGGYRNVVNVNRAFSPSGYPTGKPKGSTKRALKIENFSMEKE